MTENSSSLVLLLLKGSLEISFEAELGFRIASGD